MGEQRHSPHGSMVVAGAANVRVIGQQLALHWLPRRRTAVEAMLEDRLDRAVGAGADVEAALAGRFQPVGAVMARQAQNADGSSVSLFGVRPALQDQRDELGGARPMAAASARMRSIVHSA